MIRFGRAITVRGFTLLELLVVLAIAGLLMAAVPPLISSVVPGAELKSATRELAVALKQARFDAISHGESVDITFMTGPARYTVGGDPAQSLPRNTQLHIQSLPTSTGRAQNYLDLSAEPFQLRFFPDGSSSGGSIELRRGKHRYALNIGWLMGQVSISQDDAGVY